MPVSCTDLPAPSAGEVTLEVVCTYPASAFELQLELAYDRYEMRGRDGVTPQSAYPTANIYTAGARVAW